MNERQKKLIDEIRELFHLDDTTTFILEYLYNLEGSHPLTELRDEYEVNDHCQAAFDLHKLSMIAQTDEKGWYLLAPIRLFLEYEGEIPPAWQLFVYELPAFLSQYSPSKEGEQLVSYLQEKLLGENHTFELMQLIGIEGSGRKTALSYAAQQVGIKILTVNTDYYMKSSSAFSLHELMLTAYLHKALLCLDHVSDSLLQAYELEFAALLQAMKDTLPLCFVLSEQTHVYRNIYAPSLSIKEPDALQRQRIWLSHAGAVSESLGALMKELADNFVMTPKQIVTTLSVANTTAILNYEKTYTAEQLRDACHQTIRHSFGNKAKPVKTPYTLKDLILNKTQKHRLQTILYHLKHRQQVMHEWGFSQQLPYGGGLSVLFAGPSGTGKTMAASVLANEAKRELVKAELSTIVSKYIGETEKQLDFIFEQAKKSQVILFFDEADVLFGKRMEVKEANDKYNNMEAAYLLQKMEEYDGVVILATNFVQNIDEAFRRRLKFRIDFNFPGKEERRQLWQNVFPKQVPIDEEVDWELLAEYELSGSQIKNIAVSAAYLAAGVHSKITMKQLLESIGFEFEKSGKYLSQEELGLSEIG